MSRARRLLASCLVVIGIGTAAAANPALAAGAHSEVMPWSLLSRFGGDADGDGRLDGQEPRWLADLDVFPVLVTPSPATCAAPQGVRWSVDGEPLVRVEVQPGAPCRVLLGIRGEGRHTVLAQMGAVSEVADVTIDDRLVVALGDSVASGEGNPQGPNLWLDPPCHRSASAGFEQAARLLSQGLTRRSITFVSLACSGAEVEKGLLGRYAGVAPDPRVREYAPQLTRLEAINRARPSTSGRPGVDAVLVSVGANDVQFSSIVKSCSAPGDCRRGHERQVFADLGRLRGNYDRLGSRLNGSLAGAPVVITEYFDPTRDERGAFCRQSVAFTTQGEARWAYEALLRPLNAEVAAASVRNGWRYVGGIATDFEHHGYCADKAERWVRRLSGSLFAQGDLLGTLHPSFEGHLAIAQRVAVSLGKALGLAVPPQAPVEGGGRSTLEWIGVGLAALLAAPLVLVLIGLPLLLWPALVLGWLLALLAVPLVILGWLLVRLLRLLRPTNDDPCPEVPGTPELPALRRPETLWQLLAIAAGVAALVVSAVLAAGLAGSVILWLRFWSSRLPADQSVDAVSKGELVATGTEALALFVLLGLVAVGLAWLLDSKGQLVRSTRRGLLAIAVVELIAAILIGDFRRSQALQLATGLVLGALLFHYLVDRALGLNVNLRSEAPGRALHDWISGLGGEVRKDFWPHLPRRLWQAVPFAVLVLAVWESLHAEGADRKLYVLLPLALAAALFVLPGGLAAKGTRRSRPAPRSSELRGLEAARIALAVAGLACVLVLITRDAAWLAGTAAVAALLALFCLTVAAASKDRFAPYALAILIAVPLFGAAAAMLRGIDSPELQPIAAILKSGEPVCGLYVGESDGKLWVGHLVLDEQGDVRRPRRGSILSVDSDRIAERTVGPLEPVALAQARAVELRDQLLNARGDTRLKRRLPTCEPPEPVPRVSQSWQRRLAERYQPELIVDRQDGFWPVPVTTLLSMRDRRAAICRQVGPGPGNCLRLSTQGEFPWGGGEGEGLEYPAADTHIDEQHDLVADALGTADPDATATEYFLVTGEPGGERPITIQYWFFYPYNYLRVAGQLLDGGFHEGDFESVGVVLSAKTERPRYLWMNRHDKEGRVFPWDDTALRKVDDHPSVFVARGSHASYESCGRQRRDVAAYGLVDDYPTCEERRQLHLAAEATPLTDLSHVAWACWHGHFGHRLGGRTYERIPYLIGDAPLSPLWQQNYGGVRSEPCRGVDDPGQREGPGEEVVEEPQGVPARIRQGAGRLDPVIDECADWEDPPTVGPYMVVCDQDALTAYLASGLEDPGSAGVRIDDADARDPQLGQTTLPAVRRDAQGRYFDSWRIVAANPATVSVYASCQQDGRIVGARFAGVPLDPAEPLHLLDRGPGGAWRLASEVGDTVAAASPFVVRLSGGDLVETAPAAGRTIACGSD